MDFFGAILFKKCYVTLWLTHFLLKVCQKATESVTYYWNRLLGKNNIVIKKRVQEIFGEIREKR